MPNVVREIDRQTSAIRGSRVSNRNASPRFETDDLCNNCRYVLSGPTLEHFTCYFLMKRRQRKENMTLLDAARWVAKQKPDYCDFCDPNSVGCSHRYWDVDKVAPKVLLSRAHLLHSIPSDWRLPAEALSNITAYTSRLANEALTKPLLFEFNPSIAILPVSQVPSSHTNAIYIATYRVSSAHACFDDPDITLQMLGGSWENRPKKSVEYLGIALLDRELNIVAETVVGTKDVIYKMEDVRVSVLHDQMFISSFASIHPLWIIPPASEKVVYLRSIRQNRSDFTVAIREMASCTRDGRTQSRGKNLNYFVDAQNRTVLELEPMGAREVVDLDSPCIKKPRDQQSEFLIRYDSRLPFPSFGTTDELEFVRRGLTNLPPYTYERGGACCLHFEHNGLPLLLGIAHRKTVFKKSDGQAMSKNGIVSNHYFSTFYAFQRNAPYRTVARTGNFCFGFPNTNDTLYSSLSRSDLKVGSLRYNCPRVHFVSGMTYAAHNHSEVIISYGVNDCIPNMVIVLMDDIIQLLFSPKELAQT
ncbi:hypothetical protein FisN_8Hu114 [Fistulifera solaris]|uniref:Uncharacterized protein n=1 Tax=Fistulifera solaris TaxID=1519565 RepID=A0A1Z5JXZ1_FISSO|nr:hypothetical protein FisN_8Hu114 [Fistulifera solaris]|eukprot:GAX18897.1 hypothetical protein FisN_8Hu114 [Fistulifera solaris]